jgi:3-hydroxybutyryl-CoA dehydrogenase
LTVGKSFIEKLINNNLSKGKLTEAEAKEIESRINTTTSLTKGIRNVDMIIEAVPEIPKLKYEIFAQLAKEAKSDAILATNTSSISITKIAACAKGAESRVIGAHFMNPVPIQKGVEIIQGLQTSEETLARTTEFTTRMNKVTSVAQDSPGFLANRILIPYINEAVIALETGIGKKEDIDNIMKNGCAMPMGPLQLADFVGLDTCLAIINVLYQNTGDSKYRPSVLLTKMVDAGYLGVKSGKGFYDYPQKGAKL